MTHLPKNPYCPACRNGKAREKYSRKGAFKRELSKWGHLVTCDIIQPARTEVGTQKEKYALCVYGAWSGFVQCYGLRRKTAESVIKRIQQFAGDRTITEVHCDGAKEFETALEDLKIRMSKSQPGVHRSNAIIERKNQDVEMGTAETLSQAGLPSRYWPYAAPVFCHHLNCSG